MGVFCRGESASIAAETRLRDSVTLSPKQPAFDIARGLVVVDDQDSARLCAHTASEGDPSKASVIAPASALPERSDFDMMRAARRSRCVSPGLRIAEVS